MFTHRLSQEIRSSHNTNETVQNQSSLESLHSSSTLLLLIVLNSPTDPWTEMVPCDIVHDDRSGVHKCTLWAKNDKNWITTWMKVAVATFILVVIQFLSFFCSQRTFMYTRSVVVNNVTGDHFGPWIGGRVKCLQTCNLYLSCVTGILSDAVRQYATKIKSSILILKIHINK